MQVMITIPKPSALLKGFLMVPLVLLLILTWGHDGTYRAGAAVPPGILIHKLDRATNAFLAGSCYAVWDSTNQTELFTVCDNDFQGPPVSSPVCIDSLHPAGGGVCSDTASPSSGLLFVQLVPGTYHVVEIKPPPGYNLKTDKQVCVASSSACSNASGGILTFLDDATSQINITKIAQYSPPSPATW